MCMCQALYVCMCLCVYGGRGGERGDRPATGSQPENKQQLSETAKSALYGI